MADEDTTTTPAQDAEETQEQVSEPEAQDAQGEPQAPATGMIDELPEWARALVSDLRKENASHRQAKKKAQREAEAAARRAAEEQGKFKELYEAEVKRREEAEAARVKLELDALKSRIANEIGLPAEFANRLDGDTEDELRADAQVLLAALPKPQAQLDAARGTNAGGHPIVVSEEEINEFAARMGVHPKFVRPELLAGGK